MQPYAAAALSLAGLLVAVLLTVAAARARNPGSLPSAAAERFAAPPSAFRKSKGGPMPKR